MALLQAIRYHVHRLAKAESGRQELDAANEMASEDDHLEDTLASLQRHISNLQEFKRVHEAQIQELKVQILSLDVRVSRLEGQ